MTGTATAATADRISAGKLRNGTPVEAVVLKNAVGVAARILTYGATLQSLIAPDRHGLPADIVLGHDDLAGYEDKQNYFGVTVGRYANRIAKGRFTLDGKSYQLPLNNGSNSLHGGGNGFDRSVWTIQSVSSGPTASVVMTLTSPDGAAGYPGEVVATVTYALDDRGSLTISFAAITTRPTILNMTNHALFNMAGEGATQGAMANRLTIPATAYTPVDNTLIPTGELRAVAGTVFDFTKGRIVAEGLRDGTDAQIGIGRGYDHNFVIDQGATALPKLMARLEDPASGRALEVLSTEPGLQFYSGNFLDGTVVGKRGHLYRMGDGIALEPQKFPDAPNQPNFGSARVDPGKPYRHVMIYRLSVAK
ncbi:aldose epimerase family protein [Sphingomonas sp. SUN039]|uniref:aldose epimerase family protein n=1 Tax=Sphingomonas sp. SUN039 TaxID=2937787 RepID=UPI0021647301|nr:aldose epimerase family protein [Sphingomonas sp. SUN039]UVO55850.1 galactose mutarotase [Sphingomonas sp. SUN039]